MIKFFRKLRWSSLSRKRFPKYLLYATGEIVLVVIGILIALNINTWNENNKKNELKKSYINSLLVDYKKDTMQLNNSIEFNKIARQEIGSIIASLSSEDIKLEDFVNYFKTFNRIFRTENTFNTNSFNVLISTGDIDLFDKNLTESLMELNRLQNSQTTVNLSNGETYMELMSNSAIEFPVFASLPSFSKKTNELLWADVDLEKTPAVFTNIIGFKYYILGRYLELAEETNTKTEEVLSLLNTQLKND